MCETEIGKLPIGAKEPVCHSEYKKKKKIQPKEEAKCAQGIMFVSVQ